MQLTITIDDELYARALALADPGTPETDIILQALTVFIRVQAGKRLSALGGSTLDAIEVPRRRNES